MRKKHLKLKVLHCMVYKFRRP